MSTVVDINVKNVVVNMDNQKGLYLVACDDFWLFQAPGQFRHPLSQTPPPTSKVVFTISGIQIYRVAYLKVTINCKISIQVKVM